MSKKYTMHVVTHTHWDREWYKAFQHFRMRLVDLTDHLIHLLQTDPEFKYFVFDGQTIVLDDYLEIRPENEAILRQFVKEGRILIGPWYNQPDEFLVSGEGMIRNLMLGRKMGDDWGNWMPVGYVPDAFGHISQFPQIMRGFGIDNAVLFRGISTDQVDAEFTWRSPDGSEVLCVKMPDDNAYSNFYYRLRATIGADAIDFEQSRKELQGLFDDCVNERPTTSNMLFMDGVDHIFADDKTPAIIKDANENMDLGTLVHSTLPMFIEAVKAENPDLKTVEGELRWTNRAWKLQSILPHVMSSRVHLKQMNHQCQNLLERWAEPFSTVAWTLGKGYPTAYLAKSWEYVLKNHPHDSICGCSIDQVHKDMVYRFDQARLIAEPVAQEALQFIADKVNTAPMGVAADAPKSEASSEVTGASALPWEAVASETPVSADKVVGLVVFNPLSWDRTEVVEGTLLLPTSFNEGGLQIVDAEGNEVPFKTLGPAPYWALVQPTHDIPSMPPAKPIKVTFLAEDVPSLGYKTFFIKSLDTPYRSRTSLMTGPNTAENEYLVLTVEADGTLTVIDKESERIFTGGMMFEDGGDFGDGYVYSKPTRDTVITSLGCQARTSVVEDNICRTVFRVEMTMPVPASRAADNVGRSEVNANLKLTSFVTLAQGAKRIDIVTELDNAARDHRIRVCFPSGMDTECSYAESTFDVVKRVIATPETRDWREQMPPEHPQRSFVDLNDGEAGLAVINEGLYEYEAKDDTERTLCLTLLRATGGGVGGSEAQQEGQMIGKNSFRYAIFPHSCGWQDAKVWREAWGHNLPMKIVQTGVHEGELPMTKSFLAIDNPSVVLSIVKKAERSDEVITRVFNITESQADCEVCLENAGEFHAVDFNEEQTDAATIGDGCANIELRPKQIFTLAAEVRKG